MDVEPKPQEPTGKRSTVSLETFLSLARKYRVDSLKVGDWEVKFGPLSFVRPASEVKPEDAIPLPEDEEAMCACGHSLETQHSEAGCLMAGCTDLGKCASTMAVRPKGVNG